MATILRAAVQRDYRPLLQTLAPVFLSPSCSCSAERDSTPPNDRNSLASCDRSPTTRRTSSPLGGGSRVSEVGQDLLEEQEIGAEGWLEFGELMGRDPSGVADLSGMGDQVAFLGFGGPPVEEECGVFSL